MPRLLTIGYEGASLEDFIATLKHDNVSVLADVREFAGSRRRGFAKTALSEALSNAGIDYVHFRELGDPKPGRDAARAGDYPQFREIFSDHLQSEAAQKQLSELDRLSKKYVVCLMCYEREPKQCHRSILVDELRRASEREVRHLGVKAGISSGQRSNKQAA
ncbi:DUF488 domain-containing protein [Parvularcula sp. ZS-1/3]|uniref:DUF488 domain-containing protein n=1 Tax=Parvularcula mediterranea TaxID=2732508 RepID=A0A7Y3RPL1_9PROT|nr:DUF488 domain-containing protein [Parvularcula mediterranea]NNU17381.1 DUF488 domain-containing protein [Parvularcula mediterranea]